MASPCTGPSETMASLCTGPQKSSRQIKIHPPTLILGEKSSYTQLAPAITPGSGTGTGPSNLIYQSHSCLSWDWRKGDGSCYANAKSGKISNILNVFLHLAPLSMLSVVKFTPEFCDIWFSWFLITQRFFLLPGLISKTFYSEIFHEGILVVKTYFNGMSNFFFWYNLIFLINSLYR